VDRIAGFRLKAGLKDLGTIRRFIAEAGASRGIDPSTIYDLNLAVTELVTNTLDHGYRKPSGSFEIEIIRSDSDLLVRVRDEAPAFDPTRLPPPDLSFSLAERPLGKMGIYLAQGSVDEFTHREIPGGGNEIILMKKGVFASHHQEEPNHGIKD
jgi:anti-sigma regulatory factor (Ser/Thr protein kinase)